MPFHPGAIEDLGASFRIILAGLGCGLERPIGDLPYLCAEQHRRLAAAAAGPRARTDEATLHGAFEDLARVNPDLPALSLSRGALSYGAVDGAANGLAHRLKQEGLAFEAPVAVLIERSPAHLVALLAILKSGGAYLPLGAGIQIRPWRRSYRRGAALCLTNAALAVRAGNIAARVLIVDERTLAVAAPPLADRPRPSQLAYFIATSGTSGQPKIVAIEHRAAANTIRHSLAHAYAPGDLACVPSTRLAGVRCKSAPDLRPLERRSHAGADRLMVGPDGCA